METKVKQYVKLESSLVISPYIFFFLIERNPKKKIPSKLDEK